MEILLSICSKTDGSVREAKCELGDRLMVGRGAEDGVLLDGPDLSREHLMLSSDGVHLYVTDLSVNGTWLNGTRLRKSSKARLRPEDSIEVPGYAISVTTIEEPQEVRASAPVEIPTARGEVESLAAEVPKKKGLLAPVTHFIGSFSFAEKFYFLVGIGGLVLLYTYMYA